MRDPAFTDYKYSNKITSFVAIIRRISFIRLRVLYLIDIGYQYPIIIKPRKFVID